MPRLPLLLALALLLLIAEFTPAQQPLPARIVPPPAADATEIPPELTDYIKKEDPSYSWKLASKKDKILGTVYTIDLISQTWHNIKWDHKLLVFVPRGVKPQATMVLWNDGDAPDDITDADSVGLIMAGRVNAPVALLFGVPKQPLYGGKTEDALIAESFVKYLVTEDPSWPLLFPMVKSIIRGMDTLQAFAKQEWKFEIKDFVISGASKRGWTSWLTAATGDKRVKAIAPLVFDTLNIAVQMKNQIVAFGKPSDMIKDYSERDLIPIPNTAPAHHLWKLIDPWTYRDRITMPKMLIFGTNDEYWPLNAVNTYWDGLKGDKWIMYVPNAGHHLVQKDKKGDFEKMPMQALETLTAFCRCQVYDKPMPKIEYSMVCPAGSDCMNAKIVCDIAPLEVCVVDAHSKTRDFRKEWWEPKVLEPDGKKIAYKVDLPKQGYTATLPELEFEVDTLKFKLSVPVRILEAPKK